MFAVSASGKQKYRDLDGIDCLTQNDFDGDTSSVQSFSTTHSVGGAYLPTSSITGSTSTIKRYKMERKNSQQSQHGKQEQSTAIAELNYNIPPEISELQNSIQVKIADLGNACYDVSASRLCRRRTFICCSPLTSRTGPPLHGGHPNQTIPFR